MHNESTLADRHCEDYINSLYQDVTGFSIYETGEVEALAERKIFPLYGEILYYSMNKLIAEMQIEANDVFYDLGSGVGKIPLQVFLKTTVQKSCGIEALTKRHACALQVYEHVKKDFPEIFINERSLQAICANFLEVDIFDATILYLACFESELLLEIGKRADQCKNLKYFISLRPIPNKLPLKTTIEVDCSFGPASAYIYAKP